MKKIFNMTLNNKIRAATSKIKEAIKELATIKEIGETIIEEIEDDKATTMKEKAIKATTINKTMIVRTPSTIKTEAIDEIDTMKMAK